MTDGHHEAAHDHLSPDVLASEQDWDERYGSKGPIWSGEPNPQLVAEASELAPGAALDVGCGEGADAIWLARRGWRVTGLDISGVALSRAAAAANRAGSDVAERITWLREDIAAWAPPAAGYDLVSAQFMQLPEPARSALHRQLVAAVGPGGVLLVVGHSVSDLHTGAQRPPNPERFFAATDIAAQLNQKEWDILTAEARPREALDPDGHPITVRDEVLAARRRPEAE